MDISTHAQMKKRLINKGPFQDKPKWLCVKTNYSCPTFNDSTDGQSDVPTKKKAGKKG